MSEDRRPWNSRYVLYARAHGYSAAEMCGVDEAKWPGGCMTGFIVWIQNQWADFWRTHDRMPPASDDDHQLFDAWLAMRVGMEEVGRSIALAGAVA